MTPPHITARGDTLFDAPCIGGVSLFSTVDWPEKIVATVFLRGCSWRCPYCHNKELLDRHPATGDIAWSDLLGELERRRDFIDGVVFSGGEPTMTQELPQLAEEVRERGLLVGLHTNGSHPQALAKVLSKVDWVGLDIKAPFARYDEATTVQGSGEAARRSLGLIRDTAVPFEVRTTLDPAIFDRGTLLDLSDDLQSVEVPAWALQRCRSAGSLGIAPLTFDLGDLVAADLNARFTKIFIR